MFGLPIILAALALNGAPTSIPVTCNPAADARGAAASTFFTPGTTTPLRTEFGTQVCAGLVWLAASPAERVKILALNPAWTLTRFDRAAGVALIVVLHETRHDAGDRNEAHTEACAMTHLDAFAAQWAPASDLAIIVGFARTYDAELPADYHGAVC
jgi:hypothetical protein